MKYLIINDLKYIFSKKKAWIILYLMILMLFPIFFKIANYDLSDIFLVNIGLTLNNNYFIFIIFYLFNLSFYIYAYLELNLGNLKVGVDNIFLRINKQKLIISKLISSLLFTLIMSITSFIIVGVVYELLNINIENLLSNFIIYNLYYIIIDMVIIMGVGTILYKNKFLILIQALVYIACYLIEGNIMMFLHPYLFKNKLFDLIIIAVIIFITYIFILKKTIIKIFERSF